MTQIDQPFVPNAARTDHNVSVQVAPVPANTYVNPELEGDEFSEGGVSSIVKSTALFYKSYPTPDRLNAHIINAATGIPYPDTRFRVGNKAESELFKVKYVGKKGAATLFYPDGETYARVNHEANMLRYRASYGYDGYGRV